MSHVTHWVPAGCLVDVSGTIDNQELAQINSEMTGSPRFDDIAYFLRDLTAITRQGIDFDALSYAAFFNWGASLSKKHLRGAFVVGDEQTAQRVGHYIRESARAGSSWDQRVFVDRASALTWAEAGAQSPRSEGDRHE